MALIGSATLKMGAVGLVFCFACMALVHRYQVDVATVSKFLVARPWSQDHSDAAASPARFEDQSSRSPTKDLMFTLDELAEYDGRRGLYLSVLGHVYNVEKGAKHYAAGGAYHGFTGRDASRAFVTGEFTPDGLRDDVLDLRPDSLLGLQKWSQTYRDNYEYVGKLIGRYYTATGEPTDYTRELEAAFEKAKQDQQQKEAERIKFPPCNSEWNQETGGRVWCTTLSGGIKRDWLGFPRQMYSTRGSKPKCVCVRKSDFESPNLKPYPGCPNDSTSCKVN